MSNKKLHDEECPYCLGLTEVYNGKTDTMETCKHCQGTGKYKTDLDEDEVDFPGIVDADISDILVDNKEDSYDEESSA